MGIEERKEREKEFKKDIILSAAKEIINEEGLNNLTIRKIANRIDYSPAIIYHYFTDKDEILNWVLLEGYGKIVKTLVVDELLDPANRVKQLIKSYIESSLRNEQEYKNIMLSDSKAILNFTSVLQKGLSKERESFKIFIKCLKELIGDNHDEMYYELTVQVIWTSMYGLILRMIIENELPDDQKELLINRFLDFIMDSIK